MTKVSRNFEWKTGGGTTGAIQRRIREHASSQEPAPVEPANLPVVGDRFHTKTFGPVEIAKTTAKNVVIRTLDGTVTKRWPWDVFLAEASPLEDSGKEGD